MADQETAQPVSTETPAAETPVTPTPTAEPQSDSTASPGNEPASNDNQPAAETQQTQTPPAEPEATPSNGEGTEPQTQTGSSDDALLIWAEQAYGKDSDMYKMVAQRNGVTPQAAQPTTGQVRGLEPIQEMALRFTGFSDEAITQAPQVVAYLKALGFITGSDSQKLGKDITAQMFFEGNPERKAMQKDIQNLMHQGRARTLDEAFTLAKQLPWNAKPGATPAPAQAAPVTPPSGAPSGASAPGETPGENKNFAWDILGKI